MSGLSRCGHLAVLVAAVSSVDCRSTPSRIIVENASPALRDGQLVEDVGIETLGGVFTPLLARGTVAPAEVTEGFATATDDQAQLKLRMFRGVSKQVSDNHALGTFVVSGLPKGSRGKVTVDISFGVTKDAVYLQVRERSGARVLVAREGG